MVRDGDPRAGRCEAPGVRQAPAVLPPRAPARRDAAPPERIASGRRRSGEQVAGPPSSRRRGRLDALHDRRCGRPLLAREEARSPVVSAGPSASATRLFTPDGVQASGALVAHRLDETPLAPGRLRGRVKTFAFPQGSFTHGLEVLPRMAHPAAPGARPRPLRMGEAQEAPAPRRGSPTRATSIGTFVASRGQPLMRNIERPDPTPASEGPLAVLVLLP